MTLDGYDFQKHWVLIDLSFITKRQKWQAVGPGKQKDDLAVIQKNRRKAAKFATMTFAYRGSSVLYFKGNALHTQAAAVRADGGTTSGHYILLGPPGRAQVFPYLSPGPLDLWWYEKTE